MIQITNMNKRGMQFMKVPDSYYSELRERLSNSKVKVEEDLNTVSNAVGSK